AEKFSDDKGLVWPESIAPYKIYLAAIGQDEAVIKSADELYNELQKSGIEVLYDDRDVRPGEKFADAELLGIPHRVVLSPKTAKQGKIEYKHRTGSEAKLISLEELKNSLNS